MSDVSDNTIAGLTAVAFALPLVLALIAQIVEKHSPEKLWPKITFPVLWLASLWFFGFVGQEGSERLDNYWGDFSAYWWFGVCSICASAIWIVCVYLLEEEKKEPEATTEDEAPATA